MRMDGMTYCEIFSDCYHCPLAACPLADGGAAEEQEDEQETKGKGVR